MNNADFEKSIQDTVNRSLDMLRQKNQEYAGGEEVTDRFEGFLHAAEIKGTNVYDVLSGLMSKHTSSIYKMLLELSTDPDVEIPIEKVREKVSDHINYLLFFEAMMNDRKGAPEKFDPENDPLSRTIVVKNNYPVKPGSTEWLIQRIDAARELVLDNMEWCSNRSEYSEELTSVWFDLGKDFIKAGVTTKEEFKPFQDRLAGIPTMFPTAFFRSFIKGIL